MSLVARAPHIMAARHTIPAVPNAKSMVRGQMIRRCHRGHKAGRQRSPTTTRVIFRPLHRAFGSKGFFCVKCMDKRRKPRRERQFAALNRCAYLTFRRTLCGAGREDSQPSRPSRRQHRPLRYVRHPMYAGALLVLQSARRAARPWYGLPPRRCDALLALQPACWRSAPGDESPVAADYAARVRYAHLPWIW